jgi:hypothetical protein
MPGLSLRRIKSLRRPREGTPKDAIVVEHVEQASTSTIQTQTGAMPTVTEEPPPYELPPYTEADDQVPDLRRPRRASSPAPSVAPSLAPSYRQSHPPPVYRPRPGEDQQRREAEERQKRTIFSLAHNGWTSQTPRPLVKDLTPLQRLCHAALEGRLSTVQALLESGTDVHEASQTGKITSAIHDALRGPNPGLALLLLHYPCEQGKMFGSLVPPTGPAEAEARIEARLKFLLDLKDNKGRTPLHLAASAGAADVAREMSELGADVNALDNFNRTPLHLAAKFARAEALDVLLEFGADPGLVREKLWEVASPQGKDELGDSAFVRRVVMRAVFRRESGMKDEKGQMEDEDDLRNFGWRGDGEKGDETKTEHRQPPRRSQYDEDEDEKLARFQRSIRGNVELTGFSPLAPPVAGPSLAGGPLRAGPRLHLRTETMRFNPAFVKWKSMCDTVQEEHRRQKNKNVAEGSGAGGLTSWQ